MQLLHLDHCIVLLIDLDTKKIGAEVFGKLQNMNLKESGEGKMVREGNEDVLECIGHV